ncbi:MAG: efflux RND transporter periplasmic adaptor subunit [Candidatus Aphodosoma sp.]
MNFKNCFLAGILLVTMLLTGCKSKQEDNQKIIIKTAVVDCLVPDAVEEYSFIAKPWRTSELSFRVSGLLDKFNVHSGNYYSKGSVIAELDPRDFIIRKDRAEAVYHQLDAEYRRATSLFEKDNVSASAYEKTKADYLASKAGYDAAVNDLNDTRLVAPFDGYIGEVFIDNFQDVKASQPIVTLIDINSLKIEIYVTQEVAKSVQHSGTIDLIFDTEPDTVYNAEVVEVSKGTMSNNLSYLLTARLNNDGGNLLAGMSGKARLKMNNVHSTDTCVVIPIASLCHRPVDGDFVWIVNENDTTVNKRAVKFNTLLPNGFASISCGLNCGERVALTGLRFLSDGMKVDLYKK